MTRPAAFSFSACGHYALRLACACTAILWIVSIFAFFHERVSVNPAKHSNALYVRTHHCVVEHHFPPQIRVYDGKEEDASGFTSYLCQGVGNPVFVDDDDPDAPASQAPIPPAPPAPRT